MSDDPLIQRLTQLTPDAGGLDRDALLFAAGRASARPNRGWLALASVLAATQLVTLGLLLWPRDVPPTPDPVKEPTPVIAVEPPVPTPPEGTSAWVQRDRFIEADGNPPLPSADDLVAPSDKKLRAFGHVPVELLQ